MVFLSFLIERFPEKAVHHLEFVASLIQQGAASSKIQSPTKQSSSQEEKVLQCALQIWINTLDQNPWPSSSYDPIEQIMLQLINKGTNQTSITLSTQCLCAIISQKTKHFEKICRLTSLCIGKSYMHDNWLEYLKKTHQEIENNPKSVNLVPSLTSRCILVISEVYRRIDYWSSLEISNDLSKIYSQDS
jgi:hypothetical protein